MMRQHDTLVLLGAPKHADGIRSVIDDLQLLLKQLSRET
jgi:hypothetical protein